MPTTAPIQPAADPAPRGDGPAPRVDAIAPRADRLASGVGAAPPEVPADRPGLSPRLREALVRPAPQSTSSPAGRPFAESDSWAVDVSARRAQFRAWRTLPFFYVADALALSLCGWLAAKAMTTLPVASPVTDGTAALALLPLGILYAFRGMYTEIWSHPIAEFRLMANIAATTLVVAAAAASVGNKPLAIWFLLALPLLVTLGPLPRLMIRQPLSRRLWWGFPTLVISSGAQASAIGRLLLDVPRSGLRPALLCDPTGACRAADWGVINDPDLLASMIRHHGIRHAVVSLPHLPAAQLEPLLDRYSRLIPHLIVLSNAATLPSLWGAGRHDGKIGDGVIYNQRLLTTLRRVKRAIDLVVTIAVLAFGLPLLVPLAILTKCSSRGPVFYGHTRIGRGGRKFKAWKFRTMRVDGDAILARHLAENPAAREEWERDRKLRHDPRVTLVGNLLRKTSFDELPQLWNVLRGEMSLVGPRPIVADEVAKYREVYEDYSSMPPGITGLWQVSGRSQTTYAERVKLDEFYVKHWSFWLDIYILGKTFVALISRDGAV